MNLDFLQDAFKKLESLTEDTMNIDDDGIKELNDVISEPKDNSIDVIDPEAESEEDVLPSYEGKVILSCPVCHSFLFDDFETLDIDKASNLANVSKECPYCCEVGGFTIIGRVAPFDEEPVEDTDEETTADDEASEIENADDVADENSAEDEGESAEEVSEEEEEKNESLNEECDPEDEKCAELECTLKEVLNDIFGDKWTSYSYDDEDEVPVYEVFNGDECLGEYYLVNEKLVKSINEDLNISTTADSTVISDGEKEVTIANVDAVETDTELMPDESVDVTTADATADATVDATTDETTDEITDETTDEITDETVTTDEPTDSETDSASEDTTTDEVVTELSDEEKAELTTNESDKENESYDVDLTEIDEKRLSGLVEQYLKKTYSNVENYNMNSVSESNNALIVEGVINFKSGKSRKTTFKFEAKDITKNGKARFIGENVSLSRARKPFILTGTVKNGNFLSESFNYNYTAKNSNGNSERVRGTVRIK